MFLEINDMKALIAVKISTLAFLCLAGLCGAETIIFQSGASINAPVIADRAGAVIVDIGFTALLIPRDKIISIQSESQIAEPNSPAAQAEAEGLDGLYHTAPFEAKTLQQCYKTVAPAVVKISTPVGLGSGFFINQQGYLITNYHVIEKETRIMVTLFSEGGGSFEKKQFQKIRIVAINPFVDLALLKVEDLDEKVPFVYLGRTEQVRVGQSVFAVGNPLGLERSLSEGAITTVSRAFEGLVYLQTNADINPGNSGGPLFDMCGQVIGVTNMGAFFFGGLGFAIPVDCVKDFIDHYQAFAYDKDNPNSGYRYLEPDGRLNKNKPPLKD